MFECFYYAHVERVRSLLARPRRWMCAVSVWQDSTGTQSNWHGRVETSKGQERSGMFLVPSSVCRRRYQAKSSVNAPVTPHASTTPRHRACPHSRTDRHTGIQGDGLYICEYSRVEFTKKGSALCIILDKLSWPYICVCDEHEIGLWVKPVAFLGLLCIIPVFDLQHSLSR